MREIIKVILAVIVLILAGIYFTSENDKLKNKILCIQMIAVVLQFMI